MAAQKGYFTRPLFRYASWELRRWRWKGPRTGAGIFALARARLPERARANGPRTVYAAGRAAISAPQSRRSSWLGSRRGNRSRSSGTEGLRATLQFVLRRGAAPWERG